MSEIAGISGQKLNLLIIFNFFIFVTQINVNFILVKF